MKKILYCVYGVFFTFIVWHVMFAASGFDGAVKNSFDKGMDYPRLMAKKRALGLTFEGEPRQATVGHPVDVVLTITGHNGSPVQGAAVTIEVARPASRETAASGPATEAEAGRYKINTNIPNYGHWLVTARIVVEDETFTHEYRIYAEKDKTDET